MEVMVRSMDMWADTLGVGIGDTVSENVMDIMDTLSVNIMGTVKS